MLMQIELDGNPDFGEARVQLESGERIRAASGAMNWMQGPIGLKARLMGGISTSLARKFLGGTSLLITDFSASCLISGSEYFIHGWYRCCTERHGRNGLNSANLK